MSEDTSSRERYEFCQLIEYLILDIQHLEIEVVATRFELSRHLDPPHGDNLRYDILSDLSGRYFDHPAYTKYLELCHGSLDPMDSDEWIQLITEAARGRESTTI